MYYFRHSINLLSKAVLLFGFILTCSVAYSQTGGRVVEHKVEKGQTLFGIARKYQASVAEIKAVNQGLQDGLQVGQIIKVPIAGDAPAPAPEVNKPSKPEKVEKPAPDNTRPENVVIPAGARTHVVGAGQTLSMIARTYKTTVAEILKLNNLKNPSISVGQKIIVSVPAGTETTTTKKSAQVPAAQQQALNAPVVEQAPNGEIIVPVVGNPTVGVSGLEQQVDKGLAEGIDQDDNNKQQCLHRTAPVGTVVKVKNDLNGLSIYAKVVGKLQDIGQNERLVIRLSKSAFEKLMPTEKRFPVTVVYSAPAVK